MNDSGKPAFVEQGAGVVMDRRKLAVKVEDFRPSKPGGEFLRTGKAHTGTRLCVEKDGGMDNGECPM